MGNMNDMQQAHATLSASGSATWLYCGASRRLQDGIEDSSSVFAEEGTAAHALAEYCSVKGIDAHEAPVHPDWKEWDSEAFRDYVQDHLDYVRSFENVMHTEYEYRVDFSRWVPGGFGTADVVQFVDGVCRIIDLKFGKGVKVYAENNTQLMLYALGVIAAFQQIFEFETVEVCVSQPRLGHFDCWSIPVGDIDNV